MVKAIFFDLDGTLINTLPLYLKSYDEALKKFGFNYSDKKVVETCFSKTEDAICKKLGIPEKIKEFKSLYFSGVENHFIEGKLFDGVFEVLKLAKKSNVELVIISFAYRWYIDKIMENLDLNKYFKLVIGFEDVKRPKPDPEAVIKACNELGIKPEEAVVIGDSKGDILMGNSAGAQSILFHPPSYNLFYDLEELQKSKPTNIVQNFKEIKKLLF